MRGCRNFISNNRNVGHENENEAMNEYNNSDVPSKEEIDEYEKDEVTYITSPLKEEASSRYSLKMKIKRKVKTENESLHEIIDSVQTPKKSRNKRKTPSSPVVKANEQVDECEVVTTNSCCDKENESKDNQKITEHPSDDLQEKVIYDDSSNSGEVDTVDACVETSLGHFTEPEGSGPCEPGTSVVLEGVVWNETSSGVLVVNVSWRGRTYVGTLLDASKQDWRTPRLMNDASGIDLEYKGKSSRNRKNKNCLIKSAANKKARKSAANDEISVTSQHLVDNVCMKLKCDEKDCFKQFKSYEGLAYHKASAHVNNSLATETGISGENSQNPLNLKTAGEEKSQDERSFSPHHAFRIMNNGNTPSDSSNEPPSNVQSKEEHHSVAQKSNTHSSTAINNNVTSSEQITCKTESCSEVSEQYINNAVDSNEIPVHQPTSPQHSQPSPVSNSKLNAMNSKRMNVNEIASKKTKTQKIQNGHEIPVTSSESTSIEIARLQTLTADIPVSFASEIDSIVGPDEMSVRRRSQRFDASLNHDVVDIQETHPQNFSSQFYRNENPFFHRQQPWVSPSSFQNITTPVCEPMHLTAMNNYLNRCILNRNPTSKNP